MKLIIEFFELSQMVTTEKESALRIEEFMCNIRRLHVKNKLLEIYYEYQGFNVRLSNLPRVLKVIIASYLTPKELLSKLNCISKDLRVVSQNPALWRKISIFAQKEASPALHKDSYLLQLIGRST